MAMNVVFQYTQLNDQYIQIGPVYDALTPTVPLTGSTVVATLYAGRIPPGTPGTPVSGATDITLTDEGGGIYRGLVVGSAFGSPDAGNDYLTAVDLNGPGGAQAHWEIPSVVMVRTS